MPSRDVNHIWDLFLTLDSLDIHTLNLHHSPKIWWVQTLYEHLFSFSNLLVFWFLFKIWTTLVMDHNCLFVCLCTFLFWRSKSLVPVYVFVLVPYRSCFLNKLPSPIKIKYRLWIKYKVKQRSFMPSRLSSIFVGSFSLRWDSFLNIHTFNLHH